MRDVIITFAQLGWKCADVFAHLSQKLSKLLFLCKQTVVVEKGKIMGLSYSADCKQSVLKKVSSCCLSRAVSEIETLENRAQKGHYLAATRLQV